MMVTVSFATTMHRHFWAFVGVNIHCFSRVVQDRAGHCNLYSPFQAALDAFDVAIGLPSAVGMRCWATVRQIGGLRCNTQVTALTSARTSVLLGFVAVRCLREN